MGGTSAAWCSLLIRPHTQTPYGSSRCVSTRRGVSPKYNALYGSSCSLICRAAQKALHRNLCHLRHRWRGLAFLMANVGTTPLLRLSRPLPFLRCLFRFLRVDLHRTFIRKSPFINDILDPRHTLATLEKRDVRRGRI